MLSNAVLPPATVEPLERVIVFDSSAESSPSDLRSAAESSKPTAAELRQARALYEAEQRVKRLESNKWRGLRALAAQLADDSRDDQPLSRASNDLRSRLSLDARRVDSHDACRYWSSLTTPFAGC